MIKFLKNSLTVFFVLFCFWISGCATAPGGGTVSHGQLNLTDLCQKYDVQIHWDPIGQMVTLDKDGIKAKAIVGSSLVIVNNEEVTLSDSLKHNKGAVTVPADFKEKVLDKLISRFDYHIKRFSNIMLDPGHGGKDPGAMSKAGMREKDITLDIVKRLRDQLAASGFIVTMTRGGDEFIPLEERARLANASKVDLFVSIHVNSSRAKSIQGMEIFSLRELTSRELKTVDFSDYNRQVFSRFQMDSSDGMIDDILLDMLHNYKQAESKNLAQFIAKDITGAMGVENRGAKIAGFSVLRNTLIPAILVEVGFLSNKSEESLLGTEEYRQKIADNLAKSILNYASKQ